MGRQDFDNLLKVIQAGLVLNAATLVSIELDFELARGFIAKIWRIEMAWINWNEDVEGIVGDLTMGCVGALIRDPDDITSQAFPNNEVQHDVVAAFSAELQSDADGSADLTAIEVEGARKVVEIPEHIDLITARNMRWNVNGTGPDNASLTESAGRVAVYYTLEKVTNADILELLDIL